MQEPTESWCHSYAPWKMQKDWSRLQSFPPVGRRGFGSPFSMGAFDNQGNLSALEYLNAANDNLVTIAQIETKEAFECVEEIARVDGIDGKWF